MRVSKRLSVPLLLGAAVLLTALFETPRQLLPEAPPGLPTETVAADSYAFDVSMRNFDGEGVLLDRTDAQHLRRYASAELLEMETLQRWGYEGDSDWVAQADRGELMERNDVLKLRGDVRLRYVGESVEFMTEAMRFNLLKRTALSESPVTVFQGVHETRADQLYAILNWKQARLKGNVRTVYVPET